MLTATLDPLIVVRFRAFSFAPIPRSLALRCFKPPRGPAALLANLFGDTDLGSHGSIHTCGSAVRG